MVRLLNILQKRFYFGIALLASLAMLTMYIYTQVLGIVQNIDIWLASIPLINLILTIIFSFMFGTVFAYQLYLWKNPKTCPISNRLTGSGPAGIGAVGALLVAQCPACASLGTLFLPLSAITFLAQYGMYITLVSIGLLVFTLHYLGAFQK